MGRYRSSFVIFLAAVAFQCVLAGCNSFFTDRSATTSSSSQRFAYVSNFNNGAAGAISIFTLDTTTGALATAGSSIATGSSSDPLSFGPAALATSNSGSFLYSANDGGGISAFTVSITGALTTISGSPFPSNLTVPTAIAVHPNNKFLYVADSGGSGVAVLTINTSSGALTALTGSPFSTSGLRSVGVTVHPNGKFLYVPLESFGTGIFTIDTTSGALSNFTIVAPFANGQPQSVAITPAGTLAYVANGFSGVEAYSVNTSTGSLSRIGSNAFSTGNNPIAIITDISGRFVYVVNRDDANAGNNTLTALAIQSDGTLAAVSGGVSSINSPSSLALDPSGKFLFVTNINNATVAVFSVNSTTGQLTSAGSVNTGTNPTSIAFR